ncbi:peptide chain release factor 1 [Escherichia coli]|uniref:Peptide chain release factor 1 n=1 Tax=Escherichia coli TaxID=562 RepID=A0A377D139_ECOLX|nr:peptide chain release factor 1 [Escherichia coli]
MKPSIVAKLEALHERHEEVQALLGDAQTIATRNVFAHYHANMRS